jgi:hypothetical protein
VREEERDTDLLQGRNWERVLRRCGKVEFPHNSVHSFVISVIKRDKLTDLYGNCLVKNDLIDIFCELRERDLLRGRHRERVLRRRGKVERGRRILLGGESERARERRMEKDRDTETEGLRDSETERHRDSETERQRDRGRDLLRGRHREGVVRRREKVERGRRILLQGENLH